MWAKHLKTQRRQYGWVALADRALALAFGDHLAQHGMKRIVELLIEHCSAAGHLGRRAQIEQRGLAFAAMILHQHQRAQLQQWVALGLGGFLEAVMRIGAGGMADSGEQEFFAGEAAVDRAHTHAGTARHLFHRHIRAAFSQQLVGRTQYTLEVALGIFALTALIRLDYVHLRSFPLDHLQPLNGANSTTDMASIPLLSQKRKWRSAFNEIKVGDTGYAYVVDRQGKLIAFSDTARVLRSENVSQLQAVSAFIQNPVAARATEVSIYPGITGATVMGTYVPLETPDWAVVTELPWAEANREINQQVMLSIGITLVAAVLAGLLGMFVARRLAVPLVNLTGIATRITAGEMELQAVVGGPRETASLASAFNSMTAQLRQILGSLEQRVNDRTVDLQQALDEVEKRAHAQELLIEENRQQRETIREMSVPVLPVSSSTLVMPLVGALDTARLRLLQEQALRAIERAPIRTLILDITGVPLVDSQVAQGLMLVVQAARLLGTEVLLVGIRPEVAQAIVGLGVNLLGLRTYNDLQSALGRKVTSDV